MNLSDLPEELLSFICEETELDSLIPLALSCKLFNRIAGSHYLRRTPHNIDGSSLIVSDRQYAPHSESIVSLSKVIRIIDSMSKIAYVDCTFATSAFETRRGMRLLVLALRRVYHDLSSIQLSFKGYNSLSNEVFEDLIREVQRTRCRSFRIYGTVAFKHSSLDFNSHINHSLNLFSIPESLVLSQPLWLCKFLNSSLGLSSIIAQSTKEWTQILPKLYLPSLGALTFWGDIPSDAQTNIEVLEDFSNRHHSLSTIEFTGQFKVFSTSSKCQSLLPHIQSLIGTVSQLCYFVSHPHVLLNLSSVEIDAEDELYNLRDLLALISTRAALRLLTLHAKEIPSLQNLLSGDVRSLRSTCPHLLSLQVHEFQSLTDFAQGEFLIWAGQVFPSTIELAINLLEWDLTRKSSFAQAVADEWPSVNMLTINYTETRSVEAWLQAPPTRRS